MPSSIPPPGFLGKPLTAGAILRIWYHRRLRLGDDKNGTSARVEGFIGAARPARLSQNAQLQKQKSGRRQNNGRRKGEENMVQQRPSAVGDGVGLSVRAPEAPR
jgi:hypothetical protein